MDFYRKIKPAYYGIAALTTVAAVIAVIASRSDRDPPSAAEHANMQDESGIIDESSVPTESHPAAPSPAKSLKNSTSASTEKRPVSPCPQEWLEEAGRFVERGLIPGALILVDAPEWGTRIGTVGYADLSSSIKPAASMRYRMGGLTKLMLATIILQLEQEGKLSLDVPLEQLPGDGLAPREHEITLRDCLNMRSGLFDYSKADRFKPSARPPNAKFDPEELLFSVRQPVKKNSTAPDDAYAYSETGYILAGLIAERIEKKPLSQLFNERIFTPLNMRSSFFAETPDMPEPSARGYCSVTNTPEDCTEYDPSTLGAANAVVSTPLDALAYLRELFTGHTLLTRRSAALMGITANAEHEEDTYGLGLMQQVSHRGTWRGFKSSIRGYSVMAGYYMQGDAMIAVFINTGEHSYAMEEIFNQVLRHVSGGPTAMSPVDGASARLSDGVAKVSWQSGFLYGDKYRIYFGEDRTLVDSATPEKHDDVTMMETPGTVFEASLSKLMPGRTYYWRVDSVRNRTERELTNARKHLDNIRKKHPEIPWTHTAESETIPGPSYSFKLR